MATVPPKKSKDATLFASLQKAHKADAVVVSVNTARLNHPGSPVWDSGENVAPLIVLLLIPVVFMFTLNLIIGTAALVLGMVVYLIIIRPWVLQRVHHRTLNLAMENFHNWDILWKKGGLAIVLKGATNSRCVSPGGNWRAFATRYLPHPNVDGTEAYNAFTRAEDDDANLRTSIADLNM